MNRTIHSPDIGKLLDENLENKWVAFAHDYSKILANGDTLQEVDKEIQNLGETNAIFFKVPPLDSYYIPFV